MNLTITNATCNDIVFEQHGITHYLDHLYYNGNLVWSKLGTDHDYSQDYFTMEALGNGSFFIRNAKGNTSTTIEYSKNGGTWTSVTSATSSTSVVPNPAEIQVSSGDIVRVRASLSHATGNSSNTTSGKPSKDRYPHVSSTCEYKVYGNIESLFTGSSFTSNIGRGRALAYMFEEEAPSATIFVGYPQKGDSATKWENGYSHYLVSAENLVFCLAPSDRSTSSYYASGDHMFANCEKLEMPPRNACVTIKSNYSSGSTFSQCYAMFSGCIRLKKCDWIIDVYRDGDCESMFFMCLSMTKGPDMIRRWYNSSYLLRETSSKIYAGSFSQGIVNMFHSCVSMKKAPVIIGDNIGRWTNSNDGKDGSNMFFNCQSLEEIRIYMCNWNKSNMSSPDMGYSYNNDPFDLGSVTGRTSIATSGTWSSDSTSLGQLKVYSNFTKTGWSSNQYITTILEPPTADIIAWYCQS